MYMAKAARTTIRRRSSRSGSGLELAARDVGPAHGRWPARVQRPGQVGHPPRETTARKTVAGAGASRPADNAPLVPAPQPDPGRTFPWRANARRPPCTPAPKPPPSPALVVAWRASRSAAAPGDASPAARSCAPPWRALCHDARASCWPAWPADPRCMPGWQRGSPRAGLHPAACTGGPAAVRCRQEATGGWPSCNPHGGNHGRRGARRQR